MPVLHAAALEDGLFLWAEDPARQRRAGRPSSPPRHPRALTARELATFLPDAAEKALRRVIWLPTAGDAGPLGVPEGPRPGAGEPEPAKAELRPWQVEGARCSGPRLLNLLRDLSGRQVLPSGAEVGPDLAWWSGLLPVAMGPVVRQAVVPDLDGEPGEARAVWRPFWNDPERQALEHLAATLPGAVGCLSDGDLPPRAAPKQVVRHLAEALVDAVVRRAARAVPPSSFGGTGRHMAWLRGLAAEGGRLGLDPEGARQLSEEVRRWQQPLALTVGAPVRVCLRLTEPQGPELPWRLEYRVQSVEDPSLQVDAGFLWRCKGTERRLLDARLPGAREVLLAALGRVAPMVPEVAASLEQPRPAWAELTAEAAYRFVTETAGLLDHLGVQVQLPGWWLRSDRLRLTARAVATPSTRVVTAGAGLGRDALLEVNWQVMLGDQALDESELAALARLKAPLVQLRGQWVEVDPAQARALWEAVRRRGERRTLAEVLGLGLGREAGPGGSPVAEVVAPPAVAELLDRLSGRRALDEEPLPQGFSGRLRPYQHRGYSWLAFLARYGFGALLADDMGLGKTVQALCLVARLREEGSAAPVLLVCPTSVLGNWRREASRFVPGLRVGLHHGPERSSGPQLAQQVQGLDLLLTSYALLARDRAELTSVAWGAVLLDEAQMVKNPHTQAAQAARALRAPVRVALTGTPVENHVGDLWSIMEFLNPGLLGSLAGFRERFVIPLAQNPDSPAGARLRRLTGPFLLRRLKTDPGIVADLPPKVESPVVCTLTQEQASLYRAVLAQLENDLQQAEGIGRQGAVLSALTRLKQVCNHPAHFLDDGSRLEGRSGKLSRLEILLEEMLAEGERGLVFTQFARMGELLSGYLERRLGRRVPFLHGGVPREERDRLVAQFQREDGPPLMVLTLKAGGTGLNLTRATHVFHFDRWWNPAVEHQATDRAYRIGQERTVYVHPFLCAGTLEERIHQILERKEEVAQRVVGSGEGWLAQLDTEALRDLLRLDPEAVVD